jgi:4-aminobutyrate aminotransferase-like enzyme
MRHYSRVLKFLPPLVIEEEVLREGLAIVDQTINSLLERKHNIQKRALA